MLLPMKRILLAAACWLLALCTASPARADRVDDYIKSEMATHQIPGAVLTIIKNGKAVKTSAYGLANVELNVPARPETVFEIGSLTKQFTAAGILLLAQEGKLSVDDKISQHLQNTPPAWSNITVRHLLTHTSGIKSYTSLDGFELTRHLTQEQFLKTIGAQPLDFQPGESWKYCNTGFSLLGYIIENVSGKPYWEFMGERIFRPLGMSHTTDRQPGTIIPNRADGYEHSKQGLINRAYDLTDIFAAGAIATTVGDLAKWNAALECDCPLNTTSKQQMWTPALLNSGQATKYGFGWFVGSLQGHKNIGHGGSTSGFSSTLQRFPDDKLAIIILTNTDESIATTLAEKIATFYLK
jgi:CubicO group peptidase (beta-lactamase class C family)